MTWGGGGRGGGFGVGVVGVWGGGGLGGGVGLAGEDDGEAPGLEQGAEAPGEVQGNLLLGEVGGDLAAGVRAAVGGVEEDEGGVEGGGSDRSSGAAGFGPGDWDCVLIGSGSLCGCDLAGQREGEEEGAG